MTENRRDTYVRVSAQNVCEFWKVGFRETQTMHSGVYLHVYAACIAIEKTHQAAQQCKTVNLGFKIESLKKFKRFLRRIHNHYRKRDVVLSQFHALVGVRYTEVVYPVKLQQIGDFIAAASIGKCLYHHHYFRRPI